MVVLVMHKADEEVCNNWQSIITDGWLCSAIILLEKKKDTLINY